DPHDSPASSGSKTFGIHKYNPEYCLGSGAQRENKQRGYEGKYEDDALYEELGDDARIWRVMLDEGRINDAAMLRRFRDHLDVDLVFAGLFSAVLTTFVVQTSQTPSNTGDTTIALLLEIIAIQRAWANDPRVDDIASFNPPSPSPSPSLWINRCWFLSLVFSLLAAFGAVVVRQWLQEYESEISGPPKRRALVRHFRRVGLENYKVHLIVPILPMLLHVSLLLFFIGLTLYVRQSDRSMSNGIIALTVMIYLVYLATNLMPVFRPQCPYRSPLSTGAHWAKSLAALAYALLPSGVRINIRLPSFLSHSSTALCIRILTVKLRLERAHAIVSDQSRITWEVLQNGWKEVFKSPDVHEWEAVLDSTNTLVPDSLDSMVQISSDLSVVPLVVQASSNLPINHARYDDRAYADPRYTELLRYRMLPWFINALSTRRTVFDWVPGRENELQRMACALLSVPLEWKGKYTVLWKEVDTAQYRACVSGILKALRVALNNLSNTPTTMTDVATMTMTLLALGHRLGDLGFSILIQGGALFDTINTAYSLLSEPHSLAVLRLRPVIWHQAMVYLCYCGRSMHDAACFAITLWRSAYSEAPFPNGDDRRKEHLATLPRLSLQEWLYLGPDRSETVAIAMFRLLCHQTCESHKTIWLTREMSHASHLHMACHAIDSFLKEDSAGRDAAFYSLVAHFTGSLLATLGYESIDPALQMVGHSRVSAAFKSTFLVRPCLPLAKLVDPYARLPATFAASLLHFFVELATEAEALDYHDKQLALPYVFRALDRHATEYHDALTEEFPIEYLRPAIEMILWEPQLAVLEFLNGIVALLATQLSKPTTELNFPTRNSMNTGYQPSDSALPDLNVYDMTWCLYLDALCAARMDVCAHTKLVGGKFPDASSKLHSALLSLSSTNHDTRNSKLILQAKEPWYPLAVAFALKSTHGCKALAEWVDDLPTLVQDPSFDLKVWVPSGARQGRDPKWYRLFAGDPDKHIKANHRAFTLHVSELVSFEEAVERMQRSEERAAKESQQNSRGDGAEPDANGAEGPGPVHGGLEDRGGAEHTQGQTIARLKALGAWVARPFESVRPFLVGGRGPPSSIALDARDVDVERIAGTSVSTESERSEEGHTSPATAPEGGQDGGPGQAGAERSRGDSWGNRGGEQEQDHERGQADEVTHDEHIHAQETEEEVATPDVSQHGDNAAIRGSPEVGKPGEQGWDGEHDDDEEHGEDEEQSRDDERCRSDEGGRDDEHADQQGPDGAQGLDDDQSHDGERKKDGEQTQDGAQEQADERDRAGEETRVQRFQTPEGTDE
ncbi:hypothetical protein EV122DRAFT_180170, partial [Schizophyllum commune]